MTPTHVTHDSSVLTIHWDDGSKIRFHAIWLRDNARGSTYRHPDNDQRLFDLSEVPEGVTIDAATIHGDVVKVHFAPEGVSVDFETAFLRDHSYDRPWIASEPMLWGREHGARLIRHDYASVLADPVAKKAWLDDLIGDGISVLAGVPNEEGMVCRVAEIFGFVRETNYGRLFEVRSEAKPTNMAFTPVGLNVHADNPYRDPVPGLQLLHCLVNDAEGGDSIFVDGFRTAALLRAEDPDAFDLLTRYWAPFRFRDATADLSARGPYIRTDDRGAVIGVRYNNRSAAPLDLPFDVMGPYYAALRKFADLLHREDGELRLKLVPGELVAFDNERVFHGRTGFAGGARHLQGCYADKDALRSLSAILTRQPEKETAR